MSRLSWRGRSVLASGAAVVLVGIGVAALAFTGGQGGQAAPATTSPAASPLVTDARSAELQRSVDDLLGQVDALEAALAAPTPPTSPTPGGLVDDRGGDRPVGVGDDGPERDRYGDDGDDDGDDDGHDDRGSDDSGSDDRDDDGDNDHGDDRGAHDEDEGHDD